MAEIRIVVEVSEGGATWEGGERVISIPADSIDWGDYIEKAISAAAEELNFVLLGKG